MPDYTSPGRRNGTRAPSLSRRLGGCYTDAVSQPAWIDEYWERGFVRVPAVFPAGEIAELAGYFDEILERATGLKAIAKQGLTEFRVVPIEGRPTLKFAKWASASHAGLNAFRTSPVSLSRSQTS